MTEQAPSAGSVAGALKAAVSAGASALESARRFPCGHLAVSVASPPQFESGILPVSAMGITTGRPAVKGPGETLPWGLGILPLRPQLCCGRKATAELRHLQPLPSFPALLGQWLGQCFRTDWVRELQSHQGAALSISATPGAWPSCPPALVTTLPSGTGALSCRSPLRW